MNRRIGLTFAFACLVGVLMVRVDAQRGRQGAGAGTPAGTQAAPAGGAAQLKADSIGGVVTGAKGPEAGVWVIVETTDLPTKYVKIVVTDDAGRYMLPDLPQGNY